MIEKNTDPILNQIASIWHDFTFARYFGASVIALLVDLFIYSGAIMASIVPSLASAIGYSVGIIVHWMVSSNFVFIGKKREGAKLQLQRALFAGSALLGLGITISVVKILSDVGTGPLIAKLCAVIVSFVAVYAIRKWGVFR